VNWRREGSSPREARQPRAEYSSQVPNSVGVAVGSRLAKPPRSGARKGGLEAAAANWTMCRRGRRLRTTPSACQLNVINLRDRPGCGAPVPGRAPSAPSPVAGAPAAPRAPP